MRKISPWSSAVREYKGSKWKASCFVVAPCTPKKTKERLKVYFDQSRVRGAIL